MLLIKSQEAMGAIQFYNSGSVFRQSAKLPQATLWHYLGSMGPESVQALRTWMKPLLEHLLFILLLILCVFTWMQLTLVARGGTGSPRARVPGGFEPHNMDTMFENRAFPTTPHSSL